MDQRKSLIFYLISTTVLGVAGILLTLSLTTLDPHFFFTFLICLAIIVVSQKINFHFSPFKSLSIEITFADSLILVCYLLFDAGIALTVSFFGVLITRLSVYRRDKNMAPVSSIVFNIFSIAFTVSFTTFICDSLVVRYAIDKSGGNLQEILPVIFIYALLDFLITTTFILGYSAVKFQKNFISEMKKSFFVLAIAHLIPSVAGTIIYFLIKNASFLTAAIGITICGIFYLSYKKIVGQFNNSLAETQRAQEEKAELEKMRAEQAEKYAAELAESLVLQESIGEELQKTNFALENIAYQDQLTGIPNRTYLIERIRLLLELKIDLTGKYYLMFLNLSRFKNINDSLGHNVGDKVLSLVARRLRRLVREEDTVARVGGDEFAIILNDVQSLEEVHNLAEKIYKNLSCPFSLYGQKIFTAANIGISPFEADHLKPEDVLRDADIAMQHAKETTKGYAFFDKDLRSALLNRLKLESDLRFAVQRNEFSMYYQPVISLKDGELIGFEALLRWKHHSMGFISPAEFIPIAEESDLIITITDWILEETTLQLAAWQKISSRYRNLVVSVNISGRHLTHENLVKEVKKSVANSGIAPSSLKLEITETTAMSDAERTIEILKKLKETGTQLSIDDFGTGYSSLNHLHRLPFDTLKIDRSFVMRVTEKGENAEILQTIVSLAKNLKMRVIAEGIETETQLKVLQNLGCEYGQGYLLARPMPKEEMETLLYQRHSWLPNLPSTEITERRTPAQTPKQTELIVH